MSAKSKLLGNKDTKDAYLVVGPHPNAAKAARGKKAMYIVEGLTESAVAELKTSEGILSQGAKVVRRVRCDKNGEIKIEYYKDKDKLALFKKKAELAHSDKPQELKAWADSFGVGDKGFDNEKVLTVRPSYKTRRVVPLVLATVAAVAAVAGVGAKHVIDANEQARLNEEQTKLEQELEEQQKAEDYQAAWDSVPDESKLAEIYGAEQVVDRTSQIGTTLLNYNTVGNTVSVSVGNIYHIVNEPIDVYQQQKLVEYDGQQIGADKYDYTIPTISGAFEELGTQVAQEASDNGVVVATRADSNSSADINFIYGAVDPLSPTSALSDETAMREYLTELYNDVYSDTTVDEIVAAAMSSYERGFAEKATELSIENPDLIINEGDRPVVDYNDPQIQSAVASAVSKLSTNGKKYGAEEINIAYGSYKEQVIYANTTDGKYLFAIDLTNGGKDMSEIDSTANMLEKIQNVDNCKESAQLDFIVRNLNVGKVLDYYKNSYASENSVTNPQIYISDYIVLEQSDDNSNKFEISPTITIVSNNGGKIEESDLSTVRVNAGEKSSISEMVAVSVFGDAVVDQFPYYETVSRDSNNKIYEDNDLIVDDATTSLTVDYSTETTAQSTSLTEKTGNNHNKEKTL